MSASSLISDVTKALKATVKAGLLSSVSKSTTTAKLL